MTAQPVISGPKGNPLTGNLREFNQDTLRFMLAQRDYGDLTKFRFGPFEVLALNHPDYTKNGCKIIKWQEN